MPWIYCTPFTNERKKCWKYYSAYEAFFVFSSRCSWWETYLLQYFSSDNSMRLRSDCMLMHMLMPPSLLKKPSIAWLPLNFSFVMTGGNLTGTKTTVIMHPYQHVECNGSNSPENACTWLLCCQAEVYIRCATNLLHPTDMVHRIL